MPLPIECLLPLYGITVTLRFNKKNRLNFFHQTALAPFIRSLVGSPVNFDSLIKIDAPESGRHEYLLGDFYRFSLYGLNGSQDLLTNLIGALQQLPFSAARDDRNMPFRRNLELETLHDAFSGQAIKHFKQLKPYQLADLQKECAFWQAAPVFRMQLLSPIRLLKSKQDRQQLKGEARYCRQKSDLTAELIGNRLYDTMHALLTQQAAPNLPARDQSAPLTLDDTSHLFWLNIHYTDGDAKNHAMGGMTGEIVINIGNADSFDWSLWVLGQYTGFGQRSAFGFGRYRLQTLNRESSFNRAAPAASLLSTAGATANLLSAFEYIQSNIKQPGDVEPGDDDEDALIERLQNDIGKLLDGRFSPPPLQGFIIGNADNSPRPLAVPPFRDRVLQRAVAQVLQPIADALQYQHSYGFRTGRSRLNARYAIQSSWREGYRWVYESDIEDFFDSIGWQHLEIRLRALWGDDPLVTALCRWMQAPVEFEGQTVTRSQGLPQGSPLSPLLANIMLDDFDNDMQAEGFKLIRFADDFVVLCKSQQQAQRAHQAAEASLQEHGLSLNKDKTRIADFSDGFYYLGYLFVNDMALESPKRLRSQTTDQAVSKHSWLSRVTARELKAIDPPRQPDSADTANLNPAPEATAEGSSCREDWQGEKYIPDGACDPVHNASDSIELNSREPDKCPAEQGITSSEAPSQHFGERDRYGLLLCITGECAVIRTQDERIHIERDEQTLYEVPWRQLHAVLIMGRHNITTPALTAAMEFNIPLHFASMTGKYQGVVWNGQAGAKGSRLWLKQQQSFAQEQTALLLSREIVGARISNIRETLRIRAKDQQGEQIDSLSAKLAAAQTLAELNGLEGSAARIYFSALKELLPAEFGFDGRNRRPPLDPYNALLSLGFSVLYSCLESVLRADGLLPWQGVYHQQHGRHAALASDLMEPFRHIVERQALALIKRRVLKLEDFYYAEQNACYIKKDRRNYYLSRLMAKFDSKITAKGEAEAKTLFEHIHQQNLSLIRFIEQGEAFKAWRMR